MKYEARPMHPSLTQVISQAHVLPLLRPATPAVPVDVGYVPRPVTATDRPSRVAPSFPSDAERDRIAASSWMGEPTVCGDCGCVYRPRAGNQVRCSSCAQVRRSADATRRRKTDRRRRPATRRRLA